MTCKESEYKEKGLLIVLSGPSGVGKGTVCSALRAASPDLVYSVSVTTRKPRVGEVDGVNYFFKTREQFLQMIENDELLEWAEYVGNYYGTPKAFVEETLHQGKNIVLEIEVQGALKVKEKYPEGVFIFLMPPSLEELRKRILSRGTETEEAIRSRMDVALNELKLLDYYDYVVVNEKIELACKRIQAIITAEMCRRERVSPTIRKWMEEVL